MNNNKYLILFFSAFLSILFILTGCAHSEKNNTQDAQRFNGEKNLVTKFSEEKKYKVSLYSNMFPLTTGEIHSWILDVKTPDEQPVENVKIYVHGGMPAHQHGFPTYPRVTNYLGNGRYVVDGVKFSMTGEWEIRFNIKEEKKRDRVIFKVQI